MNLDGNKNFNQLVNEYRINDVVNMMKSDNTRKYTIQYLYTQAGFSQQSTFNKIFKEHTGSTRHIFLLCLKPMHYNMMCLCVSSCSLSYIRI
jgi:AraC-like DNA-binding protein